MSAKTRADGDWLTGVLQELASARKETLEPLQRMREMQTTYRVLLQHETERQKELVGDGSAEVQRMRSRLDRNLMMIENLEIEEQLRRIDVRQRGEDEAVVHGRVTDDKSRGLAGFTVTLTDETGKDLGVGATKVDDTGYFAIVLDKETADRLADKEGGIYLTVKNRRGEISDRRPVSDTVGVRQSITEIVTLSRTAREPGSAKPVDRETPTKGSSGKAKDGS